MRVYQWSFILLLIVVIIVGIVFSKSDKDNTFFSEKEILSPDFLEDKIAVVYFSTTSDQDVFGDGLSYALFIDENYKAKGFEMSGLELGTVSNSGNVVFLEEKNKVRLIGEHQAMFEMKKDQHTGELSGYIKKNNLFFSIYNSGYTQEGGYSSDVRYGDEQNFKIGTIPHYITASGQTEDVILILTSDIDTFDYQLSTVEINSEEINVNPLVTIDLGENKKEFFPQGPILSDGNYYYLTLGKYVDNYSQEIFIIRINSKTYEQDNFAFVEHRDMDYVGRALVYNLRRSMHLYNDEVFFVDGLGDVYSFNTITEKIKKSFSISNYEGKRYYDQVYFSNDTLYVFRYNFELENFTLEDYDISTGEMKRQNIIDGPVEMISASIKKGKTIHSYDFRVLSSNFN